MATLAERLFIPEYANFLKTGVCLSHTKGGLEVFSDHISQDLQRLVLSSLLLKNNPSRLGLCLGNPIIEKKGANWIINCNDRECRNCTGYIGELQNYCSPSFKCSDIYWNNSDCTLWPNEDHHWEMAKLFIWNKNPTKVSPKTAAETDLPSILNFIENCSLASRCVTDVTKIQKVRDVRNAYMHSPKTTMSEGDFMTRTGFMLDLLNDINGNYNIKKLENAIGSLNEARTSSFCIRPYHELKVIAEKLDDVDRQTHRLLTEVKNIKGDRHELTTVSEARFGELLDNTKREKKAEAAELTATMQGLRGLFEKDIDTLRKLERRVEEVEESIGFVNTKIDEINMTNKTKHEFAVEAATSVVGGAVGGAIGIVGGSEGIAAGASVGVTIGKAVGQIVNKILDESKE